MDLPDSIPGNVQSVNRRFMHLLIIGAIPVFILVVTAVQETRAEAGRNWHSYLGDDARSHYSTLGQINKENVHKLVPAWIYRSREMDTGKRTQIQCNPLVLDGVLYGTTALLRLVALEAATGRELWRFDPVADSKLRPNDGRNWEKMRGVNRGVVYWAGESERRILFAVGHFLFAIDPVSGGPILDFGDRGRVDLKKGTERDLSDIRLSAFTPGTVFENLYFLPFRANEGPGPAAPGHIRAFDVKSGETVWTFHTIPHPGEFGYETWPSEAWKFAGGANCWAGMAVDKERGLLYVPTGSPTYDYWGGNREGQNLFANSLICLDARTGRRRWHFQITQHDLWDRDLPAPPNLFTLQRNGKSIPAVAQVTKSGHVFVFHRETGEALFPIEERPVPTSDIPGEVAWPTQPVPVKPAPFTRQHVTVEELTTRSPSIHRSVLERFARMKQQLPFQPPSVQESILIPGLDGGAEWGGAAVDPDGVMYVNSSELAWIVPMLETKAFDSAREKGRETYVVHCASCHGLDRSGNTLQSIPPVSDLRARLTRSEVLDWINVGKGAMPEFAFLAPETQEELVDYLFFGNWETVPKNIYENDTSRNGVQTARSYYDVPYVRAGGGRWLADDGYPAIKPPWGTLNAIDLNTGEYRWRVTLGEYPELSVQGMQPTGTDNYGGPVVTAGGLLFIAATPDERIRAFDRDTGRILWQAALPAAGYATPATYQVNGRQYLVIACGGGKLGSKSYDAYVAFTLPSD